MPTRETLSLFCPDTKQEVVGLVKKNPSITGQSKVVWEYDFIYCSGQTACEKNGNKKCPFSIYKESILT